MRDIRLSNTFINQLNVLLAQGVASFGARVVAQKRDLVFGLIHNFLAHHPAAERPHPRLGLRVHAVRKTPFVIRAVQRDPINARARMPATRHDS